MNFKLELCKKNLAGLSQWLRHSRFLSSGPWFESNHLFTISNKKRNVIFFKRTNFRLYYVAFELKRNICSLSPRGKKITV